MRGKEMPQSISDVTASSAEIFEQFNHAIRRHSNLKDREVGVRPDLIQKSARECRPLARMGCHRGELRKRQAYRLHEGRRPDMPFDIQEQRLYVYRCEEYKASLSERSQAFQETQYQEAQAENKIVVFVRDKETRRLMLSLDNA
jgi:uroporphyrinogen-III synthase